MRTARFSGHLGGGCLSRRGCLPRKGFAGGGVAFAKECVPVGVCPGVYTPPPVDRRNDARLWKYYLAPDFICWRLICCQVRCHKILLVLCCFIRVPSAESIKFHMVFIVPLMKWEIKITKIMGLFLEQTNNRKTTVSWKLLMRAMKTLCFQTDTYLSVSA